MSSRRDAVPFDPAITRSGRIHLFGFPAPFELLNERCTEGGGVFGDKSLGLWRAADLAGLPFLAT